MKQIIEKLRRIENELSPENLTCDGELSRSQVAAKQARLMKERKELVRQLGREPTYDELYKRS